MKKNLKKIMIIGTVLAGLALGARFVEADLYDCTRSLYNTNATATVGISNSLAAFTTNTVQQGILGMTTFTECALVATGKLSAAGTSGITLAGYRSHDGITIDTQAGALISWTLTPRGTLTFTQSTNIPASVIGSYGYVVFTDLANGNNAILSNFGVNVCIKPGPVNLVK